VLSRTPPTPHSTLSVPDNPCQTFVMKNITATICLTIAVLLGSAGVRKRIVRGISEDIFFSISYAA
jgi:hypothetical protein